jgi:putative sterol carrier protein
VRLVHADPDLDAAGRGWVGDVGVVVEAERGTLERSFVVHLTTRGGRIERLRVLGDPDDLEELEPAYEARASYSVWKQLLQGQLDPVEAVLTGRIGVKGDLQQLVERLRFRGLVDRVFARLETHFVDGH